MLTAVFLFLDLATQTAGAQTGLRPRCIDFLHPLFAEQIATFHPRFYDVYRSHSIHALSKKLRENKTPLVFTLNEFLQTQLLPNAMGESIQERTLKRILIEVFPEAKFHDLGVKESITPSLVARIRQTAGANAKLISFDVRDAAEFNGVLNLLSERVEMSLIKRGTPILYPVSRRAMRILYKIPENRKVVHFYTDLVRSSDESPLNPSLGRLLPVLTHDKTKADIVIVSASNVPNPEIFMHVYAKSVPSEFQVTTLSDVDKKKIDLSQGRWVVYNDSRGRMPELYALSDYAILKGANNLFEPLQLQVPTVMFTDPSSIQEYSPEVFADMVKTALATQGSLEVRSVDQLESAIQEIQGIPRDRILHPAFATPEGESRSSLENLLDRIELVIRTQLNG